jgi:hypothetical protein
MLLKRSCTAYKQSILFSKALTVTYFALLKKLTLKELLTTNKLVITQMNKTLILKQANHFKTTSKGFEHTVLIKKPLPNSGTPETITSLKRKRNLLVFAVIYGILIGSIIFMLVNA